MTRTTCTYCGLPFRVRRVAPDRPVYCCAGCAVADRLPREGGDWPLTAELGTACAVGFLYFNQLLLGVLGGLLAGEGRLVVAARLHLGGLGLAGVVWALVALFQWRSGARRMVDLVVLALSAATLGAAWITGSAWCAAAAGAGAIAWAARGLARRPGDSV